MQNDVIREGAYMQGLYPSQSTFFCGRSHFVFAVSWTKQLTNPPKMSLILYLLMLDSIHFSPNRLYLQLASRFAKICDSCFGKLKLNKLIVRLGPNQVLLNSSRGITQPKKLNGLRKQTPTWNFSVNGTSQQPF